MAEDAGIKAPRWRRWGKEALWLLLMALVITTLVDLWRSPTLPAGAMEAPFTLQDGTTTTLAEQSRGKPLLVYYWASWCGVCRKEMPHIENEIWLPLKDKDFVLVGVDRDEPMDVVRGFAEKMKITYPLAPDSAARVFGLYAKKEAGITRNVIIDRDGKIVFLTRLYEVEEFNKMKDVINDLVSKP